jgi:beta-phosphoglucomutase
MNRYSHFRAAIFDMDGDPRDCVVIEDAVNGIEAAVAAGMRCVAVAQSFPAERLQAAQVVRRRTGELSIEDLLGTGG